MLINNQSLFWNRLFKTVIMVVTLLMLQGCWESEKDLIPDQEAVNPFDDANYIAYNFIDDPDPPILLERKPGKHAIFTNYDFSSNTTTTFKLYDIGSFFGPDEYIVGVKQDNEKYKYCYLRQEDGQWLVYMSETVSTKRRFKLGNKDKSEVHSLAELKAIIKNIDLTKSEGADIRLTAIDAIQAAQLKQLWKDIQEKKQRKKQEEEREAARRAAEAKAAKQAAERARMRRNDQEPTEAEMNAAMRRTLAGALFKVSVTKLGSCRKAAAYDYYCRYQLGGVNWGNFWKSNGIWQFKIVE